MHVRLLDDLRRVAASRGTRRPSKATTNAANIIVDGVGLTAEHVGKKNVTVTGFLIGYTGMSTSQNGIK